MIRCKLRSWPSGHKRARVWSAFRRGSNHGGMSPPRHVQSTRLEPGARPRADVLLAKIPDGLTVGRSIKTLNNREDSRPQFIGKELGFGTRDNRELWWRTFHPNNLPTTRSGR
jgi:hypothetical protein